MSTAPPPWMVRERPTAKPTTAKMLAATAMLQARRLPRRSATAPAARTTPIIASAMPARFGSNGFVPFSRPARWSDDITASEAASAAIRAAILLMLHLPAQRFEAAAQDRAATADSPRLFP